MLTTTWFDTHDEYEAHRRVVKNNMNMSVGNNGKIEDNDKHAVYKSYRDMGGNSGNVIFGGPDAFDVTSRGGLAELMASIGGKTLFS